MLFEGVRYKLPVIANQSAFLVWQSPGYSGIFGKQTNALTNRPELLGDCHTSVRAGSQ